MVTLLYAPSDLKYIVFFCIIETMGFETSLPFLFESLSPWFLNHGIKIFGILVGAFILYRFSDRIIEQVIRKAIKGEPELDIEAERKREDTLIRITCLAVNIAILALAIILILGEFGIETTALVAGAGVAGIALAFGGQYLIRDFFTGAFIILENQYRVGDVVCLDTTCGLVEDITLRMTVLRDLDGTVHHIPNGEVKKTSNLTKTFSRVNLDVGVSYDCDIEKVIKVVNKVGQELAKDPDFVDDIKKAPEFLRVDDFGDSAIVIKILGDTQPLKQWRVAGEYRKRLLVAFKKANIVIPFPQRDVHLIK